MSFYGKVYKKVKFENVEELLDAIKVPDEIRTLVLSTVTTTTFKKNDDGSVEYIVLKDGVPVYSEKLGPSGQETEVTIPGGTVTKVTTTIKDNVINAVMTFPSGSKLNMNRVFEGNTYKYTVWKDGVDVVGTTVYEVV